MDEARDGGEGILERITDLEVRRARVEAEIAVEMLAFADLRRRQSEAAPNPMIGKLQASFAADELALVLLQPTRTVQCRLAETRRARTLLPQTWVAFCCGEVDAYRIRLVASAAGKLTETDSLIRLDDKAPAYASTHSASQTKAWLRRFVARHDPDKGDVRAKYELSRRGVWIQHHDDGVSTLYALMSTSLANQIDQLLTRRAKRLPADDRTIDNKRADELADILIGLDSSGRARAGAVIGITIPLTSLTGLTDEPGESFDGEFTLPAGMVRDLASQPGTLLHRVLTDPLGRILDVTRSGASPRPNSASPCRSATAPAPSRPVPDPSSNATTTTTSRIRKARPPGRISDRCAEDTIG